jgi:predicted TIM-barrel fold metal-dependent hydrolase
MSTATAAFHGTRSSQRAVVTEPALPLPDCYQAAARPEVATADHHHRPDHRRRARPTVTLPARPMGRPLHIARSMTGLSHCGALRAVPLSPVGQPERRRFSVPRLDAHAHLFSPQLAEHLRRIIGATYLTADIRSTNATDLLDKLDRADVERALVLSTAYINAADSPPFDTPPRSADEYRRVREDNDFTAGEAATSGTRLIPFASINPKREYAVEELTRCLDRNGMRGLKTHFANSDVRLRDPQHVQQVHAVFAEAADRNAPVVAHIFNERVEGFGATDVEILVSQIIEPLRTLRVSVAHLGGGGGFGRRVQHTFSALVAAVASRPQVARRVWVDCAAVMHTTAGPPPVGATTPEEQAQLGKLLQAWGIERILWGSDTEPDAVDQARGAWPLGEDDWETMAGNDGAALVGSP